MPDGEHGRVYASTLQVQDAWLWAFDSESGQLVLREALEPNERLFHVDRDQRELYVYGPGQARVLDADALTLLRTMVLPSEHPTVTSGVDWPGNGRPTEADLPIFDVARRQLIKIHRGWLKTYDPLSGSLLGQQSIGEPRLHPMYTSIDRAGRYLYVATPSDLPTWLHRAGTDIWVVDTQTGRVAESRSLHVVLQDWLEWDDGAVVTMTEHKVWPRQSAWSAGREQRRLTEADIEWLVYDSIRENLLGTYQDGLLVVADPATLTPRALGRRRLGFEPSAFDSMVDRFYAWEDDSLELVVADSEEIYRSLEVDAAWLDGATPVAGDALYPTGRSAGVPSLFLGSLNVPRAIGTQRPLRGRLERVVFASRDDWWPAAPPTLVPKEATVAGATMDPSTHDSHLVPTAERERATDALLADEPLGDATWYPSEMQGALNRLSPNFDRDGTIFSGRSGLGVMRSQDAGLTWQPATAGVNALRLTGLEISPDFERDRRLVVTTFTGIRAEGWPVERPPLYTEVAQPDPGHDVLTAWRSQNAGESWEPIGRYAALAFSPDYVRDRELYAFGYLSPQFFVSTDFGTTWEPRGKLPELGSERFSGNRVWVIPATEEQPRILLALAASDTAMGGVAQRPLRGSRLFRSTDGGDHWDLAWEAGSFEDSQQLADGLIVSPGGMRLIGPTRDPSGDDDGSPSVWIFSFEPIGWDGEGDPAFSAWRHLVSRTGMYWWDGHLKEREFDRTVAAFEDGRLLVKDMRWPWVLSEARFDDFVMGPPRETD